MKKILIIHIARMGDLIQTSPLIMALKDKHGQDTQIDLLISEAFYETASALPGLNGIYSLKIADVVNPLLGSTTKLLTSYKLLQKLGVMLQSTKYDIVLNLTHTDYSAALTYLANGVETTGRTLDEFGVNIVKGNWTNYYSNSIFNRSFNRFNLVDVHSRMAGVIPQKKLYFNLDQEIRVKVRALIKDAISNDNLVIGIVPGASNVQKRWEPMKYGKLLVQIKNEFDITAIIIGSSEDLSLSHEIIAEFPDALNYCGKTSLQETAALLEACDLVITNDTGPMHLAAAMGTRVLDISLGSAMAHDTAPYGEGHIVVEPRMGCYPCHSKVNCSHVSCHNQLSVSTVFRLAANYLEGRELTSGVSASQLNEVRIYQTGFDPDGWEELVPLKNDPISMHELVKLALREMWKKTLSGESAWHPDYFESATSTGVRVSERYLKTDRKSLEIGPFGLSELSRIAKLGAKAAVQLSEIINPSDDLEIVSKFGDIFKELDGTIARLAYGHPEISPLVSQFIFSKDTLSGSDLTELAKETGDLYQKLADWSAAVEPWMSGIIEGIYQRNTEEVAA